MSLVTPFEEARAALGLDAGERDPAAIKKAYRRAIAAHPPDRDPDGFRRAREAYELLTDRGDRARGLLLRRIPLVPPPAPPDAPLPPPRGAAAVALLRALAAWIDPDAWPAGEAQAPGRAAQRPARRARPGAAAGADSNPGATENPSS